MSLLETMLVFVGIPVVIYVVIAGLSYLGNPYVGQKPTPYRLGEPWTHPPVLWSATDEVTVAAHAHAAHHGAVASTELIGGRAHGAW